MMRNQIVLKRSLEMSKRKQDTQLTKDSFEAGGDEDGPSSGKKGTFQKASAEKLKERVIYKVKRKSDAPASAAPKTVPTINFGAPTTATAPAAAAAAPPTFNAFAKLMNKDNWECPECYLSNSKDATQCAACEMPKGGAASVAPAAAPATSADGGVAAGGFTFGGGDTVTATSDAKADAGDAAVGAGFTFGGDTGDTVSFGSFGGDGDGTADGGFSFGSTDAGGDAGGFTFDASSFSEPIQEGPKPEFKDKKAEPSGTETDTNICKQACKVYQMKQVTTKGEDGKEVTKSKFAECGSGDLHINTAKVNDKTVARMVLRQDKIQRLVLNAPIYERMTYHAEGEKYVKFVSKDLEGETGVFLLKFKNNTEAKHVLSNIEKAIGMLKA